MLPLLVNQPFHSLKHSASIIKDKIALLFFKILSSVNTKWSKNVDYYEHKIACRKVTLFYYPDYLVQLSLNRLDPAKACAIQTPRISSEDYCLSDDPIENPSLSGLCLGASIDFMNRVKNAKPPFWETVYKTAQKFSGGCTKKGFVTHHSLMKIELADQWVEKKIEKPSFSKIYYAKTVSFFTKNYKCKLYSESFNRFEELPEGDFFVKETKGKESHVICLFKRKEGTALFDPNYGTLYFKDSEQLIAFLKSSTERMFGEGQVDLTLFVCKDKVSK